MEYSEPRCLIKALCIHYKKYISACQWKFPKNKFISVLEISETFLRYFAEKKFRKKSHQPQKIPRSWAKIPNLTTLSLASTQSGKFWKGEFVLVLLQTSACFQRCKGLHTCGITIHFIFFAMPKVWPSVRNMSHSGLNC